MFGNDIMKESSTTAQPQSGAMARAERNCNQHRACHYNIMRSRAAEAPNKRLITILYAVGWPGFKNFSYQGFAPRSSSDVVRSVDLEYMNRFLKFESGLE